MDGRDALATRFEEHRAHLRSVAHRMLGTFEEADDAVQETWLRLDRSDTTDVANLGGWLTRVLARVCLDMLRARASQGEVLRRLPDATETDAESSDPEREAVLADSVGFAMLVVLETLEPAERVAFVLHDVFAVPSSTRSPGSSGGPPLPHGSSPAGPAAALTMWTSSLTPARSEGWWRRSSPQLGRGTSPR
jgi:RNA polymerase sigma factor (sigma-70 family)